MNENTVMNEPTQEAVEATTKINAYLERLKQEKKLIPITVKLSGGNKIYMEWIEGTTVYLSNLKKIAYNAAFAELYYHTGKVPTDHFVRDNYLLKVSEMASITAPTKFWKILNQPVSKQRGMQYYLDGVLYMDNVPFSRSDEIHNDLLQQRNDGTIPFFRVLKVIDPSGNTTEFHASNSIMQRFAAVAKPSSTTIKTKKVYEKR